jgi:hypothetical protein
MMNNQQRLRQTIYNLKREYGRDGYLYRLNSQEIDIKTGQRIIKKTKYPIDNLIILPLNLSRKFDYDFSYLRANSNFTYGALYDPSITKIIIDGEDVDIEILIDDYLVVDKRKFSIKLVERLDDGLGYLITAKDVGAEAKEIFEEEILDELIITDEQTLA